jgi:hypothetical protein
MNRLLTISVLLLALSGCATLTGTQANCFDRNEKFSDAAACMQAELPRLKWASNAPLSAIRDYKSYLRSLAAKNAKGDISDEDAKMQMQEYMTKLRVSYQ